MHRIYITSEDRQGKEECNILTARSKIGKKSVPRPEIQESSPSIVMAGDSICVALFKTLNS